MKKSRWPTLFQESSRQDLLKFLSLFCLIFFVFFNYVILRVSKDALILNVPQDGAKAIPFIKIWMVTPIAFALMAIEIKLAMLYSRFKVFIINVVGFMAFYLLFFFILYPNMTSFSPVPLISLMRNSFPESFSPFITMIEYWPISLFYVLSEMWASVVISLLAWGFANSVNTLTEAKNHYGNLGVAAHIAYFTAGILMQSFITSSIEDPVVKTESMQSFLIFISVALTISSMASIYFFYFTEKILVKNELTSMTHGELKATKVKNNDKKKNSEMGTWESLIFVFKSPYLRHLSLMVIGYGITINVVEVIWKTQVRKYFPTALGTMNFMAEIQVYLSFIALFFQLTTTYILKKWGWGKTAMICPAIIFVTGILFFSFVLMPEVPWHIPLLMGLSPLGISVWLGAWQNVLSKGSKNSIFNVCKELAFIPLDEDIRLRGKAAIDVLGERFGKFGGSLLSMGMLMLFTSFDSIVIGSMIILLIFSIQWIFSTQIVHREFLKLEKGEESFGLVMRKSELEEDKESEESSEISSNKIGVSQIH